MWNQMEIEILNAIQKIRTPFLDTFFQIITKFGDHGIFWIAVALCFVLFRKTRKTGWMMGCALILGLLVGNLTLKPLVARIRPYDLNPQMELLVARLSDYSFPSGHTLASFEASTVLMLRDKRFGIPALVLSILVAFSRLYLYVHYPTDVLAGLILGVIFGVLGVIIVNFAYKKLFPSSETIA